MSRQSQAELAREILAEHATRATPAKSYEIDHRADFPTAPVLTSNFRQANASVKPLERPRTITPPPPRQSNRAGLEGTKLYDAPQILQQFDQVKDKAPSPPRSATARGSTMVANDKPFPQPNPPGHVRRHADRASYNRRLSTERFEARRVNDNAPAIAQRLAAERADKTPAPSNERSKPQEASAEAVAAKLHQERQQQQGQQRDQGAERG